MATTTNYGWATPDDTALVKDGASAIRTLGSSIDTTTKALNPSTTLGDIEYRSATANTNTRLPIGTEGQILSVNGSGVPTWTTPAASGGMTLLSTTTMSGTSVVISSINQTYKRLVLVGYGLNRSSTSSTRFYPQNDTTDLSLGYAYNAGGTSGFGTSNSTYAIWPDDNNGLVGTTKALNFVWTIDEYANTSYPKPFQIYGSFYRSDSSSVVGFQANGAMYSTLAVNKITISADSAFNAGQIKMYGVN